MGCSFPQAIGLMQALVVLLLMRNIIVFSEHEIKQQARIFKAFLSNMNSPIKNSSCLQAISKMYGFVNWSTFKVFLKKSEVPKMIDEISKISINASTLSDF
jgi:hypothetical protein